MKTKFNVKYYYKGEKYPSNKNRVVTDYSSLSNTTDIKVRARHRDLYPEFFNRVVCRIKDTGNELIVSLPTQDIILDYSEAEDLYTALHFSVMRDSSWEIKEKL